MATPVVNSISPLIGSNDINLTVRVFGSNFDVGVNLLLDDIQTLSVTRINSNTIQAVVPSGIPPGEYDVVVVNPLGETAELVDGYRAIFPLPDPPFSDQTREVILGRILGIMDQTWDVSEGSFPHAVASAVALEIARAYIRGNDIIQNFFPQHARAGYLNLWGEAIGLPRILASRSIGTVTFTGTTGTSIPVNTQVATVSVLGSGSSAVAFITTQAAVIDGSGQVNVPIQSVDTGAHTNVGANQITRLLTAIGGVSSVTNAAQTLGGRDIESDDEYRVRLLSFVANPVAGGNAQDYVTWALEVSGVGSVSVVPLGRGAGTVDVYILDDNLALPQQALIDAVQDYIAPAVANEGGGKAPIGSDVLILAPTTVPIDVSANVTIEAGFVPGDVESAVEANLADFLTNLSIGDDVIYTHVANVIHDTPGVADYSNLLVNAATANVPITVSQKALANTITVTAV